MDPDTSNCLTYQSDYVVNDETAVAEPIGTSLQQTSVEAQETTTDTEKNASDTTKQKVSCSYY
jgi:hypothetical protein